MDGIADTCSAGKDRRTNVELEARGQASPPEGDPDRTPGGWLHGPSRAGGAQRTLIRVAPAPPVSPWPPACMSDPRNRQLLLKLRADHSHSFGNRDWKDRRASTESARFDGVGALRRSPRFHRIGTRPQSGARPPPRAASPVRVRRARAAWSGRSARRSGSTRHRRAGSARVAHSARATPAPR